MAFKMNYNRSSFPYKDSAYDKNGDPPKGKFESWENLPKPPPSENDTIKDVNFQFPKIDILPGPKKNNNKKNKFPEEYV